HEEFERLRDAVRDLNVRNVVIFGYWTGWRINEVLGVQREWVDSKAEVLRIPKSKNREPRTIPYGVLPELKEAIEHQVRATEGNEDPRLFPFSAMTFYRRWREAAVKAGLQGKEFHDFRRTAVTRMEWAGVPRNVAMLITGHKSETIYARYNVTRIGDQETALDMVKRYVEGAAQQRHGA